MSPLLPRQSRSVLAVKMRESNPGLTIAAVAKLFGITSDAVSKQITRQHMLARRRCPTCWRLFPNGCPDLPAQRARVLARRQQLSAVKKRYWRTKYPAPHRLND